MGRFEEIFVSQDIYGYAIGVNYRGRGAYQTRLGGLCTLVTYVLIIVNAVSIMIAFNDGSK